MDINSNACETYSSTIMHMRKNPEFSFTSEGLLRPFKGGERRVRVNHAMGIELVKPQVLNHYVFFNVHLININFIKIRIILLIS